MADMYVLLPTDLPYADLTLKDLGLYAFLSCLPDKFPRSVLSLSRYANGSRAEVTTALRRLCDCSLVSPATVTVSVRRCDYVPINHRFLWSETLSLSAKGLAVAIQLLGTSVQASLARDLGINKRTVRDYLAELRDSKTYRFSPSGSVELLPFGRERSTLVVVSKTASSIHGRRPFSLPKKVQNPTMQKVQNPTHIKSLPERSFILNTRKVSKDGSSLKSNLNPFRRLPDRDLISSVNDADRPLIGELIKYTANHIRKHPDDEVAKYVCEHTDPQLLSCLLIRVKEHLATIRNIGAYLFRSLANLFRSSHKELETLFVREEKAREEQRTETSDAVSAAEKTVKEYRNEPDLADRLKDNVRFRRSNEAKAQLLGMSEDYLRVFIATYHTTDYQGTRMGKEYARLRYILAFLDSPYRWFTTRTERVKNALMEIDAGEIERLLAEARRIYSGYRLPSYIADHEDALRVLEEDIDVWEQRFPYGSPVPEIEAGLSA